jgi:hypothetical protein
VSRSRKVGRKRKNARHRFPSPPPLCVLPSFSLSVSPPNPVLLLLTSLRVELPQHFPDDLPDGLQRLQVVLGLVVVLAQSAYGVAEGAGAGVGLGVEDEDAAVRGDGRGALVRRSRGCCRGRGGGGDVSHLERGNAQGQRKEKGRWREKNECNGTIDSRGERRRNCPLSLLVASSSSSFLSFSVCPGRVQGENGGERGLSRGEER